MRRFPRLIHLLPLFVAAFSLSGAAHAQTGAPEGLFGQWANEDPYWKVTATFAPDGRYFTHTDTGSSQFTEVGYYLVEGDQIIMRLRTAEGQTGFSLQGDTLNLTGGVFGDITLKRDPEYDLAADWRKFDEQEATKDAKWRAFLTIAPLSPNPPHTPIGGAGEDPNPGHVFPGAKVFSPYRAYLWLGAPKEIVFEDGRRESVIDKEDWHLLPNGRIYLKFVHYQAGGPSTGRVTTAWGRYTITEDVRTDLLYGRIDALTIELDSTERIDMELQEGRRNMYWVSQKSLYGETNWETVFNNGGSDPPGGGTPVPEPAAPTGDVNGDGQVNVGDATLALQAAVGSRALDAAQTARGDMNRDGSISIAEVTFILRKAVGL